MPITFGNSAPTQITKNFDALVSTSLANYSKTLQDVISSANPVFYELKKRGAIDLIPGSLYIAEDLMYELGQFDAYDGYDELSDTPTDGITQVQFQWRQGATPISYSMKEFKQNKTRLVKLIESKIKQAEMGFVEGFNKALLQGALSQSASNNVYDPYISPVNGASFIDPLARHIMFDPTVSLEVGNLNQSNYSWWRNRTKTSAATTYDAFLLELDNLYNTCSRGPGGPPDLIFTDQITHELINAAYYKKYQTQMPSKADYPFANIMFRNTPIVWDEYMPDVWSRSGAGIANCDTFGTLYMINTKFMSLKVESETNFQMTDFAKPPKGDSRLAHILFMGQTTISNRRKMGVLAKIPRTLT